MEQAREEGSQASPGTGPREMTPSPAPQSPQRGTAGTAAAFGEQEEVAAGGGGWQQSPGSCGRASGDKEEGRYGTKLEEKGQNPMKEPRLSSSQPKGDGGDCSLRPCNKEG